MNDPKIFFAGCLDADPYFCLKQCDRTIVSELGSWGVKVRELHKELPPGKVFRKINRKVLYPALVAKATKSCVLNRIDDYALRNTHYSSLLHISSQCYANLIPKSSIPTTITVHDVAEFDYPEGYTSAQLRRWETRIEQLKNAELVFTVSDFTRQELIKKTDVSAEKIIVNPNGIDCGFRVLDESEILNLSRNPLGTRHKVVGTRAKELVNGALETRFLVLAAGSNIYRKNLPTLFKAVEELGRRGVPVTLVKAGEPIGQKSASGSESATARRDDGGQRTERRGLKTVLHGVEIINLGFVSQTELNTLYNLCDVLAFPSFYEGFGMPVVEAQLCGLPCVVSNASSLPEVGGDGALYHDPADADALADQLERVYKDRRLRGELQEKGFSNAERFSWGKHVDILLKGFQRVLGN
ncbi:glycosyltransferase family 4 protein [Pontiella sulfatireligans]|nr:glycosyltransferase family 1 protein [Pontiella sulfatireligans]